MFNAIIDFFKPKPFSYLWWKSVRNDALIMSQIFYDSYQDIEERIADDQLVNSTLWEPLSDSYIKASRRFGRIHEYAHKRCVK